MPIINPLPYTIANGNPVDATPVRSNFSQIVNNVNANAALVGGNPSQEFLVATTANPAGAVPLAQAQSQFAGINGSSSQVFNVASGTSGTLAIPLSQIQAQFAALNGSSSQAFSVAPAASGSAQAPQIAQTIGAGAADYTNQTANRAIGTAYTNNTGRPLFVTYSVLLAASGGFFYAYINGIEVAVISNQSTGNQQTSYSYIVPPGATYEIATNGGVANQLQLWFEY